jgi:biopolymer transport protein ExbD
MDVFTILVFFLLVNSAASEVLEPPKKIALPDSVVETKPKETAVIVVAQNEVTVQGEVVASVDDIVASKQDAIVGISNKLQEMKSNVIGVSTKAVAESREVTILSDKRVPFKVLRKVMSSCTFAGYEKISLAVIQKASQS